VKQVDQVSRPSIARQTAQRYVSFLNAKQYDAIETLFADGAVFHSPNGTTLHGREAIADFYPSVVAKLSPDEVEIQRSISEGDMCVVELAARYDRPGGTSEIHFAMDFIITDSAGKIVEMAVYPRSRANS
jgi:predicted SnoaL-like aldol condensation-catalyzing enzyme